MKQNYLFVCIFFFIFLTSATVLATPDIHVLDPDLNDMALVSSNPYDFGSMGAGYSTSAKRFRILNIGTTDLILSSNPNLINISGANPNMFTVDESSTSSTITPAGQTIFNITFNPTSTGTFYAKISIYYNDPTNSPYEFDITGTGINGTPDIIVKGPMGVEIPHITGLYEFGAQQINTPTPEITFTIENIGTSVLTLTSLPVISGPPEFTIDTSATATTINPCCSTTFKITFMPTLANYAYVATVDIDNNCGPTINPYTFYITGVGISLQNEMQVYSPTNYFIANGSTTPYDIGNVNINSPEYINFKILNNGVDPLTLRGLSYIQFSGPGASAYSLNMVGPLVGHSISIQPGNFIYLTIQFHPTALQSYDATISIQCDDINNNPYEFNITGTGVSNSPEINVKQGNTGVFDILITSPDGSYNFGNVQIGSGGLSVVFTVENLSTTTALSLPSGVVIGGPDAAMFNVTQQPSNSISASGSDTFTICFLPTSDGDKSATVSIANDDPNENPFTFTLKGNGFAPVINVEYNSIDIQNGTGIFNFGCVNSGGSSIPRTFTIENSGNSTLELISSPSRINKVGGDTGMFMVNQPSQYIAPNSSTTFTITFYPTGSGRKSTTIQINSNDLTKTPYTFTITGYCGEPDFDFNGDGYNDFIASEEVSQQAYLYFGKPIQSSVINSANSDVHFQIHPNDTNTDGFCYSVSSAGDYNGDGIDDVIIGAYHSSVNGVDVGRGSAFIFLGSNTPPIDITTSNADVKLIGENAGDEFGISVSNAGDLNNDGHDDVIVGAWKNDDGGTNAGRAYIFFGKDVILPTIDASSAEVIITGDDSGDQLGCSVSSSGSYYNNIKGVIIGANEDTEFGYKVGCAYIFSKVFWNNSYDAQYAEVKLIGDNADDNFGISVSCAGDFDGNGYDDVIVGAKYDDDGGLSSGCAFIFFGSSSPTSSVYASNADVKLVGGASGDYFGTSVSSAGDFDGDGYDDVIVGAPGYSNVGSAYIFFGRSVSTPPQLVINATNADIMLYGTYSGSFGKSVSNAGAFVIVGAPESNGTGSAYIFIGVYNPPSSISANDAYIELHGVGGDCVSGG